jgi:xylan 1,4-beta-xylosidase
MISIKGIVGLLTVALCFLARTGSAQMRKVEIDASKVTGRIRSLQGVSLGPLGTRPGSPDLSKQFKDIGIDLVRTHDFSGPTDIDARDRRRLQPMNGVIFPDWEADPEKPESYVFGPSDRIITGIINVGAGVFYRLGRSMSAAPNLPPDFDKFANVCRHIAMHYNDGWANGFHYNIRYWELWNEPDVAYDWAPTDLVGDNFLVQWAGPIKMFYNLYEKVARTMKAYDPKLKIGCCALSRGQSSSPFREGLIRFAAERKIPLDFYSWHHYADDSSDPWDFVRIGRNVREILDTAGFYDAESIVSEWNLSLTPETRGPHPQHWTSMAAAAFVASSLIYMQDGPVDLSLFYSGDTRNNWGIFERDETYRKKAYVFKANGAMLKTPRRVEAKGADTFGFGVLAGRSENGRTVQILIANYEVQDLGGGPPLAVRPPNVPVLDLRLGIHYADNKGYDLTVNNLPWGQREFSVKRYRTTDKENLDVVGEGSGKGGRFALSNALPPPAIELIVLEQK